MARLLGLDFETTGLDLQESELTEVGYVLWDVEKKQPLLLHDALLQTTNGRLVSLAESITGISNEMLAEFGQNPILELERLDYTVGRHKPDYIVAHNGNAFDKPLLLAKLDQFQLAAPNLRIAKWLDTREDIPHPSEPDSNKLKHLAMEHGFLNPFAHRAVFDVLTMLKVLSHYKLDDVVAYAAMPWKTIEAQVSFAQKELAKERKFNWNPEKKIWFKRVKEGEVAKEIAACNFKTLVY